MSLPVISCEGCGLCCMHMAVPPFVPPDELEPLPPDVRADYEAAVEARHRQWDCYGVELIPCGWFDMVTGKCRHYQHRPSVCRVFELGGDSCLKCRETL